MMQRKVPWVRLLCCGATCAMLTLSYPPVDAWSLAYVALVPWLLLVVKSTAGAAALWSWLLGVGFFGIAVSWLRFVTYPGWISLALYLSLYFLAFGMLIRYLHIELGWGLVILTPLCWDALEYVRSFLLGGFAWFYLGHTQHKNLAMIQIADIGGVYAISFVLALVNGAIADTIRSHTSRIAQRALRFVPLGAAVLSIFFTWFYGVLRLREYEPIFGPRICTIQGALPQRIKDDPNSAEDVLNTYLRISQAAIGQGAALLVWPETMVPGFMNLAVEKRWRVDAKEVNDFAHRALQALKELGHRTGARLLVGGQSLALVDESSQSGELTHLNSAYYIDVKHLEQTGDLLGRYDKIELVPFGEYIPLKRYFPFLARMVPYDAGFTAGQKVEIFELEGVRFGVLICYEDTIPRLVRRFRLAGAQFLVNISNDGWFEGSAELDEHLAICVFRAVEHRVGIVRSVNTGISGFIAPTGKIEGVVSQNGRRKNVEGVLTQNVKLDRRQTLYTRYGDWLGRSMMGICLLLLVIAALRKRARSLR